MKIIFLDFDGVITTKKSRYKLDKDKLDLLGYILKETGAKIVISSSWRKHNLEETKKYLSEISNFVPFPFPFIDDIIGVTPRMVVYIDDQYKSVPRGMEIDYWLWKYESKFGLIDSFVIVDDEWDMLLYQKEAFVHTNSNTGLNKRQADRIIKILNKNGLY